MPLKLSLKPGEKFVLNGAVITNGDKRSSMVIQNKASILREKDIMQEVEADTPAKRIYFSIMMMYLDVEEELDFYQEFALRTTEFMSAVENPDALAVCVAISKDVMSTDYYNALTKCRALIEFENERLQYVPGGLPEDTENNRESA